jgi:hypothetical protein
MKPINQNQPNLVGPDFTLDEFGHTYQDLNPAIGPVRP